MAPSQFIIDSLEESDCKDYLIIWSTLRRRNWNRRNKFRYGSHWTQCLVFRKCHHLSNTTKNSNFVVRLALRHQLWLCSLTSTLPSMGVVAGLKTCNSFTLGSGWPPLCYRNKSWRRGNRKLLRLRRLESQFTFWNGNNFPRTGCFRFYRTFWISRMYSEARLSRRRHCFIFCFPPRMFFFRAVCRPSRFAAVIRKHGTSHFTDYSFSFFRTSNAYYPIWRELVLFYEALSPFTDGNGNWRTCHNEASISRKELVYARTLDLEMSIACPAT